MTPKWVQTQYLGVAYEVGVYREKEREKERKREREKERKREREKERK